MGSSVWSICQSFVSSSAAIFCLGGYKSLYLLLLPTKPVVGFPSLQGVGSPAECEKVVAVRYASEKRDLGPNILSPRGGLWCRPAARSGISLWREMNIWISVQIAWMSFSVGKKQAASGRGSASRGSRVLLLCKTRERRLCLCWYCNSQNILSRSYSPFSPSEGPPGRCKLYVIIEPSM